MADDQNPDSLKINEQDNVTPEQFNEAVRAAGRQAGAAVAKATKKNPKTAQGFIQAGQIIVKQMKKKS
jgi:hypothetical protein